MSGDSLTDFLADMACDLMGTLQRLGWHIVKTWGKEVMKG